MRGLLIEEYSIPLAKTNWDPYSGTPAPPPPPPRVNANNRPTTASVKTFLPPPTRGSPAPSRSSPPIAPSISPLQTPPLPSRSPMPLPGRTGSQGPPPIVHSTRPDLPVAQSRSMNNVPEIDWTHLSREDKEVFFSWLDEFFGKHLNIVIGPKAVH